MKVTTLIFIFVFFVTVASAQNCDIAQTGVAVYNDDNSAPVANISTGGYANFKFSIGNFGSATDCIIPANNVNAVFNFPAPASGIKPYIYDGPAVFSSGYFTWTYYAATEELRGRNTTAIPNGEGDVNVLVRVRGMSGGTATSGLTLVPATGLTDNNANNFSVAQLIVVTNPVPIKLSAFTARTDLCNALLSWKTLTESNFSHFDVEYSTDGINYIKIGTVNGKNSATGSTYDFSYNQMNGIGYYRLKLVDTDDRSTYSNVVHTITHCKGQSNIFIYPNPVSADQKLMININGYQGKLSGVLYTDIAQKVAAFELVNGSNSVSVSSLIPGIYMLRVYNEGNEVESFKVIVTK